MPVVGGKVKLCECEKSYFKSFQGIGKHSLLDRFDDIENIVKRNFDKSYSHFLAHPVQNDQKIIWYSIPFAETPKRLSELDGELANTYQEELSDTVNHFKSSIDKLKADNRSSEAESIEKAIKFINKDFVYCFDNKVVLGIWGMQLKEHYRDSVGVAMKGIFVAKDRQEPLNVEVPNISTEESIIDEENEVRNTVSFVSGENGTISGVSETIKREGEYITTADVPKVSPKEGFRFTGWDSEPNNYEPNGDVVFTAQYEAIEPTIAPIPWYIRLWNWIKNLFFGNGCLKWLLWLLLFLLLLWIFSLFFKGCNGGAIADPLVGKEWVIDDPNVGNDGGIYDPGTPYDPKPTPPEYSEVLPPTEGVLPPIDTSRIIRKPGKPVVLGNRLNILMENTDRSIQELANDFKVHYPDEKYKVVYYDDVVKRMQIEIPQEERNALKLEIIEKLSPEYELFIFDEALFDGSYEPSDPFFNNPDFSWYFEAINATKAWDITLGSIDVTVAIVDNGFSLKHSELKSKVVMPYNVWSHSKNIFPQEIDHGTHVAGTALALADNKEGLSGLAPKCSFMPVQVADAHDIMTTTSVLDGVLYALYQGADVINISLGMQFSGQISEREQEELQNNHFKEEERLWNKVRDIARRHNTIIVIAAGNDNVLAGISPMSRPKDFLIVSAVDRSNRLIEKASFSNYGDYSTISAPGVDIYSTVGSGNYQFMDGTSMASPIVTGAVALMKSINDSLTAEQAICVLQSSGKPADDRVGNLIQIDKALQKVKEGDMSNCTVNAEPPMPTSGDVQVLLSWNNHNDLDLSCVDPSGERVWFRNKLSQSGGYLEIDMNVNQPYNNAPIENIYWPTDGAPFGEYKVEVLYYENHDVIKETDFKVVVKYGENEEEYMATIGQEKEIVSVCSFTLGSRPDSVNDSLSNVDDLLKRKKDLERQIDEIDEEINKRKQTSTN